MFFLMDHDFMEKLVNIFGKPGKEVEQEEPNNLFE